MVSPHESMQQEALGPPGPAGDFLAAFGALTAIDRYQIALTATVGHKSLNDLLLEYGAGLNPNEVVTIVSQSFDEEGVISSALASEVSRAQTEQAGSLDRLGIVLNPDSEGPVIADVLTFAVAVSAVETDQLDDQELGLLRLGIEETLGSFVDRAADRLCAENIAYIADNMGDPDPEDTDNYYPTWLVNAGMSDRDTLEVIELLTIGGPSPQDIALLARCCPRIIEKISQLGVDPMLTQGLADYQLAHQDSLAAEWAMIYRMGGLEAIPLSCIAGLNTVLATISSKAQGRSMFEARLHDRLRGLMPDTLNNIDPRVIDYYKPGLTELKDRIGA